MIDNLARAVQRHEQRAAPVAGVDDAAEVVAAAAEVHPHQRVAAARLPVDVLPDDNRVAIEDRDLPPFEDAIAEGVPLIMASHVLYPAYDRGRIASQSGVLLRFLLRQRMRFRGVVVTDSIEAQAVLDRSGVATAAEPQL